MSTVICPMLSALQPADDNGQPVNRECIYQECRFYNQEQSDCSLTLGANAVALLAEEAVSRPTPPDPTQQISDAVQPAIDRLAAQERRSADLSALLGRIESQCASLAEMQQKVGERLLEEMSLVQANAQKNSQTIGGVAGRLEKAERAAERFEAGLAKLGPAIAELDGRLAKMEPSMPALEGRIAQLDQSFAGLEAKVNKIEHMIVALNTRLARTEDSNQSVLKAIEAQAKRDMADQQQRKKDEAVACNNHGVALYYRGAHEAARDAFRKALQLIPDYAEACNNLGLALSKLGEEKEAIDAFRKALALDPKMGEVYNNLGFLYHTTSQFERAAQMFGMATENVTDSSVAYTNLGNTYYAMEQHEKAVEAWRRAVDLDPLNENAQRGLRMFEQGPTDEAAQDDASRPEQPAAGS